MNTFSDAPPCGADFSSGPPRRARRSAMAALSLGLLIGIGGCTGPLDPIVNEQPDDEDPTTDPRDGTALRDWMSEVQYASALKSQAPSSLG
jgi:hypothetical protein